MRIIPLIPPSLPPITRFSLILLTVGAHLQAQELTIARFTVDGGGGLSVGGAFSLAGTIGQHDAATSIGDSFALEGGFWDGVGIVQIAGLPHLRIGRVDETVELFWNDPEDRVVLEESSDLDAAEWFVTERIIEITGVTRRLVMSPQSSPTFFRLAEK